MPLSPHNRLRWRKRLRPVQVQDTEFEHHCGIECGAPSSVSLVQEELFFLLGLLLRGSLGRGSVEQFHRDKLLEALQVLSVQLDVVVPCSFYPEGLHCSRAALVHRKTMREINHLVFRPVDHQNRGGHLWDLVNAVMKRRYFVNMADSPCLLGVAKGSLHQMEFLACGSKQYTTTPTSPFRLPSSNETIQR